MSSFLIALAATGLGFVVLDFAWLSVMVPRFYRPRLSAVLREGMNAAPALAFYVIYLLGATALVVAPALAQRAPMQALLNGALLGLTAYATYNFTNWATLKQWSPMVAVIDTIWGGILTGASCWFGVTLALRLAA